jgi:hypothetical protein
VFLPRLEPTTSRIQFWSLAVIPIRSVKLKKLNTARKMQKGKEENSKMKEENKSRRKVSNMSGWK